MATPEAIQSLADWSSNYDSWSYDDPTIPDIIDIEVFNESATTVATTVSMVRVPVTRVFGSSVDHWISMQGFLGGLLAGIGLMLVIFIVISIVNRCRQRRRRKRRINQIMMADKDSPCLLNINTSTLERADANIEPVDKDVLYETPLPEARIPVTLATRPTPVIPPSPEDDDTDRYENDNMTFVRIAEEDASKSEGELENEPCELERRQDREETVRLSHEYHYVGPLQTRMPGYNVFRDSGIPPTDNGDEVGQEIIDGHLIQPVAGSEVYSYVDMKAAPRRSQVLSIDTRMEHRRIARVTTV